MRSTGHELISVPEVREKMSEDNEHWREQTLGFGLGFWDLHQELKFATSNMTETLPHGKAFFIRAW